MAEEVRVGSWLIRGGGCAERSQAVGLKPAGVSSDHSVHPASLPRPGLGQVGIVVS